MPPAFATMRQACLAVALMTTAAAAPDERPKTQPIACPNDADECELVITGTLKYTKRDPAAKWDNLRISAVVDGKRMLVYASINHPNRTRLKLQAGTRYRFKIVARRPFGAGDLSVIDATPKS